MISHIFKLILLVLGTVALGALYVLLTDPMAHVSAYDLGLRTGRVLKPIIVYVLPVALILYMLWVTFLAQRIVKNHD